MDQTLTTGRSSYSPEDNKLRLYVGRVTRPEFDALRADGWITTSKQREAGGCDFVSTWTPSRRDTALAYGDGVIEDEDQPMAERAAQRAERFGGYRDKRLDEATGHADAYEGGPSAHGYQNAARAERAAARHDRIGDRATDAWSKAEYWTSRTSGVIGHALYKSRPDVRMGRIKVIEADLRKMEKTLADYQALYSDFEKLAAIADPEKQNKIAREYLGSRHVWGEYLHPRAEGHPREYFRTNKTSLYSLISDEQAPITGAEACALFFSNHGKPRTENDWTTHYKLRLTYENQMLEAQGGRAAHVEMVPGGWLGDRQIQKINKSPATGRVVSVIVRDNHASNCNHWGKQFEDGKPRVLSHTIETERLPANAYRPPTDEELAAFNAQQKQAKAKAKVTRAATAIPLINPTDADAERLQALWNAQTLADREASYKRNGYSLPVTDCPPQKVLRIKQATYSAHSKGSYASAGTRNVYMGGFMQSHTYNAQEKMRAKYGAPVCQLRQISGEESYAAHRVIVITDKPQTAIPAAVWEPLPAQPELIADEPKKLHGKSRGMDYTVNV